MIMLDTITTVVFGVCLAHFLWSRVILMYYYYWFYASQNEIKQVGVPLPVLGNALQLQKTIKNLNSHSDHPFLELYKEKFRNKIPKVIIDFRTPYGSLVINDPEILGEILITNARYV